MSVIDAIYLAIIQGLTEFLPISSSAHLILPSHVLGWQDQGLAFDVAVHLGTLIAVVSYFRQQVWALLSGWFASLGGRHSVASRQAWLIIWATIPAGLAGLLGSDLVEHWARSIAVIATTTIVFGLLLWWADRRASNQGLQMTELSLAQALFIGVAQAIALIPGTSRSGITMTAGLMLGMAREQAAKFSFLLSIPIIVMAGGYQGLKLAQQPQTVEWLPLLTGVVVSAISAYLCIHFFLRIIERMGMLPFVIYRLLLGIGLFLFILM